MTDPDSISSSPTPTKRLKVASGTDRGKKRSRASTDTGKENKKNRKHKDNASSPILKDDSEWGNCLNEVGNMADIEDNDQDYDNDTICAGVGNDHDFDAPKTHLSNIRKAGNTRNVAHNFATMSTTSFSGTATSTSSTSPTKKQRACPDKAQKEVKDAAKAAEDAEAAAEAKFIADCKEITRRAAAINEDSETETAATTASTSNGNEDTQVYTAAVDSEEGNNQAKEVKDGNKVGGSSRPTVELVAFSPEDDSASQSSREGSVSNTNFVFRPRT
ncbi:hypothetical protein BFW01_g9565 [Lasiodiplodia theobromae]|uniref:uncharacterized protein n=1 Tax=Lasiodiplodia theobromae TaxID=45133 RepID=UPI0015C2CF43|nr:uncharacterized protein LTHEOB_2383 [Lasiodiplodia theobromae]KAF4535391.1 hypothetical protein LTHEOB_2383 [Lasiodiplodia theobromae]KAF9638668.1 hypothetical protein BFW01_g9565 [Lasiodiplodia theobromae]